jgi:hypothetical protein
VRLLRCSFLWSEYTLARRRVLLFGGLVGANRIFSVIIYRSVSVNRADRLIGHIGNYRQEIARKTR